MKKGKYMQNKSNSMMFEHSHIKFQKLPQPAKTKMECPVTFTKKKILRFPDFYIKKDTKKE